MKNSVLYSYSTDVPIFLLAISQGLLSAPRSFSQILVMWSSHRVSRSFSHIMASYFFKISRRISLTFRPFVKAELIRSGPSRILSLSCHLIRDVNYVVKSLHLCLIRRLFHYIQRSCLHERGKGYTRAWVMEVCMPHLLIFSLSFSGSGYRAKILFALNSCFQTITLLLLIKNNDNNKYN